MISDQRLPDTAAPLVFHPILRIGARVISYIFHPLFVPLYTVLFLVYEADIFPSQDAWHKTLIIISVFVIYTLLPLVTILLCKALGFIQSVFLKTSRDRIIPYVICEIFYFWGWYVSRNLEYPREMIMFQLAIFLSSCLGLIFNSYFKVSMHAISFGVISAFILISGMKADINYGFYISIALLSAGLVCTSRMITTNHTSNEIYSGFFIGVVAQLAACFFV